MRLPPITQAYPRRLISWRTRRRPEPATAGPQGEIRGERPVGPVHPRTVVFIEAAAAMGGVQFSTLYLAQRLDPARWNALVVCPEDGDLPKACREAGVAVRLLPRPALRSTSVRLASGRRLPDPLAWGWNAGAMLVTARDLTRSLAQARPDLLVTKGLLTHFHGGIAARRLGIPCVWHVQDLLSERFWGVYRRGFGQAARWLPTQIVADGGPIVRQLPASVQDRAHVVYNGVDTRVFRPSADDRAAVRAELGIPPAARVVGHAARITPWKGQHYLLEAFAPIAAGDPHAHLLLVGAPVFDTDAYERQLRARAADLGLDARVTFAGYRHDLPRVLNAMDVFAYTSVEKDTSPLALLSAMATGLPVVAFEIEGVREVLGAEPAGILVPARGIERLSHALVEVLADTQTRGRLAGAARRHAEAALSLDRYVSELERVFLAALGHGGG